MEGDVRRFDDDVRDGYDTTREDAREFRQDARQDFDQFGRDTRRDVDNFGREAVHGVEDAPYNAARWAGDEVRFSFPPASRGYPALMRV